MRLDTLKRNNPNFKQLSKDAKLIYCLTKANCRAADFLQADKSDISNGIGLECRFSINPYGNVAVLEMKELRDSGFIARRDHNLILFKGNHKKLAHGKLKVSDKAESYYRVGVLKSDMPTSVLGKINSAFEYFSKKVIVAEFEAYFEMLKREVFHEC